MRKNFGKKPWTYPQPVYIIATYDNAGNGDAMNAAWGGINDTTQVSLCLSSGHKTVKNILERKAFTISMADASHVKECDYVGIESGNQVSNKLEKAGFHITKSQYVDAPIIDELLMCVECELVSYDSSTGHLVGEIINVNADESILTDGKIDPNKLEPIVFDPCNNTYLKVGAKVGNAFKDGLELK